MAVTWVSTVAQWGNASGSAASGSFTPTAGNQIVAFDLFGGSTVGGSITGTGTYTQVGSNFTPGSFIEVQQCFWNSSCSGAAQTVTATPSNGTDATDGFAFQYSGATTANNFAGVNRVTPGTGSGAILGTSVVVPTGAILLAVCINQSAGNDSNLTSPTGTVRSHGTTAGNALSFCCTEYSGAGASIQPSFTSVINGGADTYSVVQVLLSAAAAGNPFIDNPTAGFFSSQRLRDLFAYEQNNLLNTTLAPQGLPSSYSGKESLPLQVQYRAPRNFLNPDTSRNIPKELYADAVAPFFNPPQFLLDRVRPVVDTHTTLPKTLYADQVAPFFNPPQFLVERGHSVVDTSHGTPKTLYVDQVVPFFNPPQFLIERGHPVTDTSQQTPKVLYADAVAPFFNPPHFPPVKFHFQPETMTGLSGTYIGLLPTTPIFTGKFIFIITE